jgi:hypothetical protein
VSIWHTWQDCPRPDAPVVDLYPRAADVAVMNLPGGTVAHIHRPGTHEGPFMGHRDPADPFIATVPGDRDLLGWGAMVCSYGSLRGIRNGHHRRDRAIWHAAARAVERGGVVYVEHEQQAPYSKTVWVAVRVRMDELEAGR